MKLALIQRYLVYLFSFSLIFENWEVLNLGGISVPKIIAYCLVFISLFNINQTFAVYPLKKFLTPLLAFSGLLLASYLINYNGRNDSFYLLFMILQNVVFFWIVINIMNNNPSMAQEVLFFLNLAILLAATCFMFGIETGFKDGRLTIFGENSNRVGLYSVFSILYLISFVVENKQNYNWSRYLLLLLIIPLINIAAQTGSRSTFIGLIVTLPLFFILKSKGNLLNKTFSLVVGGVVMLAAYYFFMKFDLFRERWLLFREEGDLSGRDSIWIFVTPMLMKKPLLGVGVNGYTDIISSLYSIFYSPHNVLLEIFAYSGLSGLIAFFIFIFQIFREAYYNMKYNTYVLPLLYIFLISFNFLSGQALAVKPFWLIFAYVVVCRRRQTKTVKLNFPNFP